MSADWGNEGRRLLHYQELGQPLDAQSFVRALKERLLAALTRLNGVLPQLRARHEISVSGYATVRMNGIVPFSVKRVGAHLERCNPSF